MDTTTWIELNDGNFTLTPYSVTIFNGQMNPLNIEVFPTDNYTLFPNPTSGKIFFKNTYDNHKYKFFSYNGKLLETGKLINNELNIEIYPAGIYIIQSYSDKGHKIDYRMFKK